ncbi:MAG: choice-of-anchor J domain-containing protein [Candidatus Cloacimonetes bacterium]|nr:choice-of-anchor J domain-containing protein [Candidatus Cloacimonadota bacterium]
MKKSMIHVILIIVLSLTSLFAQNTIIEDFETGEVFPPTGWELLNIGAYPVGWNFYQDGFESNRCAYCDYSPADTLSDWLLISPVLNITENTDLVFYEKNQAMEDYQHHGVWLSTNTNTNLQLTDFTLLSEMTESSRQFTERAISLNDYSNQNVRVAFRYYGQNGSIWYIDQVQLAPHTTEEPVDTLITEFPYIQSFEEENPLYYFTNETLNAGSGNTPAWLIDILGSNPFVNPIDGSYLLMLNSSECPEAETRFIFPAMLIPSDTQIDISFRYVRNSAQPTILNEGITIEYSYDKINWQSASDFIPRYMDTMNLAWTDPSISIINQQEDTLYIAVKASCQGVCNIILDNFNFSLTGTTPLAPPENLTVNLSDISPNSVLLTWNAPANSEISPQSYRIYRNNIMITESSSTQYLDMGLTNGMYYYKVSALYESGESVPCDSCGIELIPNETDITPVKNKISIYPNPFKNSTSIQMDLKRNAYTELSIYNIKGEKIKTFHPNQMNIDKLIWDGKNNQGKVVPSGIYFIKINDHKKQYTHKILKVK